jgi:riboflavin biosynthesis pyrimidine reductase
MFVGGPNLPSTFMKLGLMEEYWLYVNPIILGSGEAMLPHLGDRISLSSLKRVDLVPQSFFSNQ